jgi:hypothetical protein
MMHWLGETNHVTVLRQSDGGTGETPVWWWDDPANETGCFDGGDGTTNPDPTAPEICVERFSGPATLLQEYQSGTNSNVLNLGELIAEYEEYSQDGPGIDVEGGLVTVPFQFDDLDVTVEGGNVTLNWGDGNGYANVHTQEFETLEGFEQATFLDFETESGTTTFADDANRLDQVAAPSITGGTTINGTLIEFLFMFEENDVAGTVPTVPADIVPDVTESIMATQAAVAAGLMAQPAATTNGENCSAVTENFSGVFTKFIWDEANSTWVGGTWNHSYFLSDTDQDGINDTVEGDDLNGDGVVEQFEVGIYENWTCTWDDVNQMQVCDDLDGVVDDTTDQYETVPTGFEEVGTGEYCLHPFTMTAGQMTFSFEDLLSSTDVTVQN